MKGEHAPFLWRDDLDDARAHAILFDALDVAIEAARVGKVVERGHEHGHSLVAASPSALLGARGCAGVIVAVVVVRRSRADLAQAVVQRRAVLLGLAVRVFVRRRVFHL